MVYIFIILFLLFCVYRYDIKKKIAGRDLSYFFTFILLVSMSSLRYRMGGDALFYEERYPEMPIFSNVSYYLRYENYYLYMPLWVYLNAVCKSISSSIILFQFLHALVFNILLFIFIKKYTNKQFSVLLLFFISFLYIYYSFEIQREVIAVGVFLLNIKNLEQKKWIKYYSLAILSLLFHQSAIIIFVLPLFKFIKFNKSLVWVLLIVSFFLSLFRSNLLNIFNSFVFLDLIKSKNDSYSTITFSLIGFLSYYFVRVILFIPIALYLYSKNKKELKYKWFYSSFLIISILAQFFVMFERLLNYLYPLYFIIVIDFVYLYFPRIKSLLLRSIIIATIFLHIFFIIDYKLFLKNEYGQHFYSHFFPYNSIIDHQKNKEREELFVIEQH